MNPQKGKNTKKPQQNKPSDSVEQIDEQTLDLAFPGAMGRASAEARMSRGAEPRISELPKKKARKEIKRIVSQFDADTESSGDEEVLETIKTRFEGMRQEAREKMRHRRRHDKKKSKPLDSSSDEELCSMMQKTSLPKDDNIRLSDLLGKEDNRPLSSLQIPDFCRVNRNQTTCGYERKQTPSAPKKYKRKVTLVKPESSDDKTKKKADNAKDRKA